MAPKKPTSPVPVESLRHDERRTTIPTAELSQLVEDDGHETLLYPRDPTLDPQLVWKGKDDQDRADLAVPAVPVYVQEKIVPQALVENLRKTAKPGEREPEATLFDDFDGTDADDDFGFYEHDKGAWSNRMILGDSLLVMSSLAEKEDLKGKVQMIYLDPPYGIKFGSNWQVSTRKRDVKDGAVADASREPEQVKAFRDTWTLGIHSYLSYLRDRLTAARDLLTDSGSVFVQIGDENLHLVRGVLDEVFGADNFVSLITFKKTSGAGSPSGRTTSLAGVSDYLVWYARDRGALKYRQLYHPKVLDGAGGGQYTRVERHDGTRGPLAKGATVLPGERVFRFDQLTSQSGVDKTRYPVEFKGQTFRPPVGVWKTGEEGMARLIAAGRVAVVGKNLTYVRYFDDFAAFPISNFWDDTVTSGFADPKTYVVQTNTKVVERCMLMCTDPGDLVLDPTCGSGTTAYVAEQWGRRWITTDTSRVALALARTRLMSARYSWYLLADSLEGSRKEGELAGQPAPLKDFGQDVRLGFIYKRVPHVTLRSIANNPDLTQGMSRDEIDRVIARHADVELLVDQPYVDTKRVRVSGRFTVESLSPHRILADDEIENRGIANTDPEAIQFDAMILDNLRTAGVQNTFKGERLKFDRLEAWSGQWIQAEGVSATEGAELRVGVSIGPEHGTVGQRQINDAALEAAKAVPGFDLLLVVGFAFDPNAWQRATEINADLAERKVGRMRVLLSKANPDLAMGDDLLKKTGAGNLFMIFGEPDVDIAVNDDEVTVEVRGLDVYDPTNGQVRPSSVGDIATWFIDTDYDGRSFFVRHAYFTGGNKPYESLKKALRADIDEAAWASLYSTTSRPFPKPSTGKIAIKVINHYGDEVLQVYEVA